MPQLPRGGWQNSTMRSRTLGVVTGLSLLVAACGNAGAEEPVPTTATSVTTTSALPTTTTTLPPISRLTGQLLEPATVERPVVAVKIDNVHGRSTPQAGLNEADVVYEIQVEAQITRLLALYQTTDAAPVGPVRSARGSEIAVLEELNRPLFVWHGANGILGPLVRQAQLEPRSFDDVPHLFYRDGGRRMPYNSFIHGTADVRATAPDGAAGPEASIFTFGAPADAASRTASPASWVDVRFPAPFGVSGGEAAVRYQWDGSKWRRLQAGQPHVDIHGQQVAVDNVIVRFTAAVDSGTVDSSGARVPTAAVVGTGEVWVFSRGTVTTGTWSKARADGPTTYLDPEGNEIKLHPGKTWISMPYSRGASAFG